MDKVEKTINTIKQYFLQHYILSASVSGKDSFCVAHCAVEALKRAKEEDPSVGPLYISTVDTTIDNFEIMSFLHDCHNELVQYGELHQLPIISNMIRPKVHIRPLVQYCGKGTILRTMTNQSKRRQCASDWKITPLINSFKELKEKHQTDKIISLSGSRDQESASRAKFLAIRNESIDVLTKTDMGYKLAPIKNFSLNDVWGLINKIDNGEIESSCENLTHDLRKNYSSGNGGTCDLLAGESFKNSKPCSTRFGCTLCSLVPEDRSLMNQIKTSYKTYGYMSGILKLRNYMYNTLNDLELTRARYGKKVINNTHIKLHHNDYSLNYRARLLKYVLTIDALEQERAEDAGEDIKFQLIDYPSIVAIQFFWSREGGETSAGEAIQIWHDIHTRGQRYDIPEVDFVAPQMNKDNETTYFDVGTAIKNMNARGLEILEDESNKLTPTLAWSSINNILTIPFEKSNKFTIGENGTAWEYVEEIFPLYLESDVLNQICPTAILKDMLNHGVIKMPQSQLYRLNKQCKIAQIINRLKANNISADDYYRCNSTSLIDHNSDDNQETQFTLF